MRLYKTEKYSSQQKLIPLELKCVVFDVDCCFPDLKDKLKMKRMRLMFGTEWQRCLRKRRADRAGGWSTEMKNGWRGSRALYARGGQEELESGAQR